MNLKEGLLYGAVALALIVGFLGLSNPKAVIDSTKVDVGAIAKSVYDAVVANLPLGASAGPDRFSPCESRDGIQQCFTRFALTTATTTACAIKSPTATSTLVRATLKVTTATSTATTWTVAKAATAFATTTVLRGDLSLGSGVLGTMSFVATSSVGVADVAFFEPNQYLVWGIAGVDNPSDTTKLNGICQATFEII